MTTFDKTKKTILITGASQGIGAALALLYAEEKVNLILIARNQQRLEEIKNKCLERGAFTLIQSIDVREKAQLEAFLKDMDTQMPIDIVIANAGVSNSLKPAWQAEDRLESTFVWDTNLFGVLNTVEPLIANMIKRESGQIALMGSIAGLRGLPQSPVYSASKAAIHSYGQALRAWLKRYRMQVSVICPGFVKTAMSDQLKGVKPGMISAEKAALIIKTQLEKNKGLIAFPKRLYYLAKLANCLPESIVDAILNRFQTHVKAKDI